MDQAFSGLSPILSGAAKAGLALLVTILVLYRTRNIPGEVRGLVRPKWLPTLIFVVIYLGWMFASNAVTGWRGPWDFAPWQAAPLLASALRILAVCLLGPIVEELIFRGVLFGKLQRFGPTVAILVTAVGWTALHYFYAPMVLAVILVDGLLLGLARWKTGSVIPPIMMHALYNLYAIW